MVGTKFDSKQDLYVSTEYNISDCLIFSGQLQVWLTLLDFQLSSQAAEMERC